MKSSKRYFIITEFVLGLLILVLAVTMLGGRDRSVLGRISVIVRDSDSSQWAAFKYGTRMAAADRKVEVVIVGTESVLTLGEEEALIENEIESGADAVIVQPVAGDGAEEMLARMGERIPIILIEPLAPGDEAEPPLPVTSADNYALGQVLAEEVLEDFGGRLEGKTMGIISRTTDSETTVRRAAGLCDALEGTGVRLQWSVAGNFDNGEANYLEGQGRVDFVAALDDRSLVATGEYAAAGDLSGTRVYGIAHSTQAAYYLDMGAAECLVVPDEFNVGYQSVTEIANGMERIFYTEKSNTVSCTVLRRETLFSEENQELLFTLSQ